jgi:hypothetical protein
VNPETTPRGAVRLADDLTARALAALAPEVAIIRTVPVWTDGAVAPRRQTLVTLDDADGRPVAADRAAHRIARDLLHRAFPAADWARPHRYDVRSGRLYPHTTPTGPAELGPESEAHQ